MRLRCTWGDFFVWFSWIFPEFDFSVHFLVVIFGCIVKFGFPYMVIFVL